MTTNPTPTPAVKIHLAGKERSLRYPLGALVAFERETGYNALSPQIYAAPNATILLGLLWAGLRHEDPDLTMDALGDSIDLVEAGEAAEGLGEWREQIEKAILAAQPELPEDGDEGKN